jgi:S1-C subfamily serine protease
MMRRRVAIRAVLAAVVVVIAAAAAVVVVIAAAAAVALGRATTGSARAGSGVVVIETNLGFQGARAAGTGMVLTPSGTVLTNNHVIRGATAIRIVVPATGRSFGARVVGYDVSDDVAVLQARGAANLRTVAVGDPDALAAGQPVKALGNAGGTGSLRVAAGTVTGLDRALTVSDDQGGSESLRGMIETDAAVQPGDSGGPLLNAAGQVVGMDTAASAANSAGGTGYAIPIDRATSIAGQIVRGEASGAIHVGGTAFLGVEVAQNGAGGAGAVVTSVVPGSPADAAGLTPGDLITAVGDHVVSSPSGLTDIVTAQTPGIAVSATYIDAQGATRTANVALESGPPI